MDCTKNSIGNSAFLTILLVGAVYIYISSPSQTFRLLQPYTNGHVMPQDELEAVLSKASMANKTVIITIVNKAYVEGDNEVSMLDLFLESFWIGEGTRGLVDHLLVAAMDQTAYDRCIFRRLRCFKMVTEGEDLEKEKYYMSPEFINMMWRRTLFLLRVLRRGYSFIFTDADVMWLRNPMPRLTSSNDDFQASTDRFAGDPRIENQPMNTGFYYIRSNNKTISLFEVWYGMKNNSRGKKEQDVLVEIVRRGVSRELGIKVSYLDTLYFSGFCQGSGDFRAVTTVHANCCRSISAKVMDLKAVHRDWRRFRSATAVNKTVTDALAATFHWSNHVGCANSWKKPLG